MDAIGTGTQGRYVYPKQRNGDRNQNLAYSRDDNEYVERPATASAGAPPTEYCFDQTARAPTNIGATGEKRKSVFDCESYAFQCEEGNHKNGETYHSHSSSIIDNNGDMLSGYKIGFWLLTAVIIILMSVFIGLWSTEKITFGSRAEKEQLSTYDKLRQHGSRFFMLYFNDVGAERVARAAERTDMTFLEKMEHYLAEVEDALKHTDLYGHLLRTDIINIQKDAKSSGTAVTALLAFSAKAPSDVLSGDLLVAALNDTKTTKKHTWRDIRVTEMKGLEITTPSPTTSEPGATTTTAVTKRATTPKPEIVGHCETGLIDYCKDVTYQTRVFYPNVLGHETAKEVKASLGLFEMLVHQTCHETIQNFTCLLLQPPCFEIGDTVKPLMPCATYCRDVASSCQAHLNGTYLKDLYQQCNKLQLHSCTQVCLGHHFNCTKSKLCLNKASKCNHVFECGPGDFSDEQGCGCGDKNKFQCPSGECLDNSTRCDNRNDCGDWGDEIDCKCKEGFNKCEETGQCFPERFWCNDVFDCADKSDEKNCTCTVSDFKCQNGYCLHPQVRCNGLNDCDDYSDEFGCECEEDQFKCDKYLCKNYIDNWCNKRPDCLDGRDEPANCTCKDYQYRCDNGQCIPVYQQCDGRFDCDDNSDEYNCKCAEHEFKCTNGICIGKEKLCDGIFNCPDGIDERQNCTCPRGKFSCLDGHCAQLDSWCDKEQQCTAGGDEVENCTELCPPGYPLQCISPKDGKSMCVHKTQICNGFVSCTDGEDERNCNCSSPTMFSCPNETLSVCLPWARYCDGVQDCPSVSEETNCTCNAQHQFDCPDDKQNPRCASLDKKCDGLIDCFNGTDEVNCTCGDILRNRAPTKLCDGVPDCADFTDEFHPTCKKCSSGSFLCSNSTECISMATVCDGVRNCPHGDDELFCVKLAQDTGELDRYWDMASSGIVYGRSRGTWSPVCWNENLDSDKMRQLCQTLGYKIMKRFEVVEFKNTTQQHFLSIEVFDRTNSNVKLSDACPSRKGIRIACDVNSISCGKRPLHSDGTTSRIVGGTMSLLGSWPSYAALYNKGEHLCGSTVLNQDWVLTAAHCLYEEDPDSDSSKYTKTSRNKTRAAKLRPKRHALTIAGRHDGYRLKPMDRLVVRTGILRNSSNSPFDQFRLVDAVIPHSMFDPVTGFYDLALVRLHQPLTYSAYVLPACLPDKTTQLAASDSRHCVTVGHGIVGAGRQPMSDVLMEVEMPAKDTAECRRYPTINFENRIDATQICAGSEDGGKDACKGDSGGPLQCKMCNRTKGNESANCSWWLFGVTSHGYSCGSRMTPGVYTKVSAFDDWIAAVIGGYADRNVTHVCPDNGFRCYLGECIGKDKLCNGNIECAFGEDESRCVFG